MKRLTLMMMLSGLALRGGCCTANTQAEDIAALQARLEAQESELAALRQSAARPPAVPEMPTGLVLLCKGAGVPLEDVRWRVQAGLDPEQAVQAAVLQLEADKGVKKGGK